VPHRRHDSIGDGSDGTYNPDQWMEPKEQRKVDKFIVYAMCARARRSTCRLEAQDQRRAELDRRDDRRRHRRRRGHRRDRDHVAGAGPRRVSPFFIPGRIINLASGYVSIEHGLKGPIPPSSPPARPARTPSATPGA
jgi:3-oxoacyl-[acyl-carrier-protein] synthase II